MATEYILENLHGKERKESKKQEFKHLFEKVDIRYGSGKIIK